MSGGVDSITTTYALTEALGKGRVIALHLPYDNTPSIDTLNFNLAMQELGIENYIINLDHEIERLLKILPQYKDQELVNAKIPLCYHIREGLIYGMAKSQPGMFRAVGALDRVEWLTGNYPKYSCTLDIAPILGMYRQQIRGLAALLSVPKQIVNNLAENDADCVPIYSHFKGGELTLDTLLFLIFEKGMDDSEIHTLGNQFGVEFAQEELDLTRNLIRTSEHKRVQHIPYPDLTHLELIITT